MTIGGDVEGVLPEYTELGTHITKTHVINLTGQTVNVIKNMQ